ncbi:hypothetical protein G6F55_014319 [Rhizopus delemar]|nr:hypothetical protein G6F55_014319 [Rhizopus delemar]
MTSDNSSAIAITMPRLRRYSPVSVLEMASGMNAKMIASEETRSGTNIVLPANDNRVIDEQSQGDDDGTHRDHVQIDVQDLHDRHRSQYRGRHDGADDQAGPHSKE